MRKRLPALLATVSAALATVVIAATPASAATPTNISPGGAATGTAGQTVLHSRDANGNVTDLTCVSAGAPVNLDEGPIVDAAADIPADPGMQFNDCTVGGIISFTVVQNGDWHLWADDVTGGVTTGRILDINATITGSGCLATVEGMVNATYDNATGELTVIGDYTLAFTSVDPVENCFGLIHTGDESAFEGVFVVDPLQTIS